LFFAGHYLLVRCKREENLSIMMNIRLTSLLISPAVLGAIVLGATSAKAEMTSVDTLTQVSQYNQEGKSSQSAVTSVSQLSDVKPTDWAFQALQSLVERYGCIAGYPDKTYRGNRAMTRYEFAAGLNACMDRVNDLIAASTADMVKKEDLATLRKLQEQFAAELATLRGRVDALEAKTATLEKQQFSTTTIDPRIQPRPSWC
jgi:Carbohydrate-selective porin, OprB family/S-layer homology domain